MARWWLPGLCLVLLSGLAGGAEQTNFVVVLCDDLGYGDLGCFGHPHIKTPHLDALAGEGLRLTDCYAAAPVCSPSRAGMLTGRIPNRLGVYDWIPANSPMHLQSREITIARLLKDAGYSTCHVGKWHCNGLFNSPEQPQPRDHGFEHWFSTQNNAAPSHKDPVNFVRNGNRVGPLTGYSSQIIVDEAISWLGQQNKSKPYLLMVWLHSPHEPIATANPYIEQYASVATSPLQAEYFGNVTQLDYEVGRLLKTIDQRGDRDRTLVYFSSDNGPETLNRYKGSERSFGSPSPLRGMKLHMYEGGIRVPGIVRWPTVIKTATNSAEPVASYDLLPTFCQIAGVKPPAERALDGTSLLPLFEGRSPTRTRPLYWQYDRAIGGENKVALRDGDWKLLANADLSKFELYHLKSDLSETRDLAVSEPARVAELSAKLKQLHEDVKNEGPTWPAGPGTGKKPTK
ncbi:MAG: sulfatase-like hydrolase/transferase [Planctomycetes bacterium]|nr:sulfatase-like hydrolase/transferase [Planctomycetota bacterium]